MARAKNQGSADTTTTAPEAKAPVVERTSNARNGITDLTAGETDGAPERKVDMADYEWGEKEEREPVKPAAAEKKEEEATAAAAEVAPAGEVKADEKQTPAAVTPPEPKIPAALVAAAAATGLPEAVALAFETPEALTKYLDSKQAAAQTEQKPVDEPEHFVFNADAWKDYPEEVQAAMKGLSSAIKTQGEQISTLRSELTKRASSVELDIMDKAIESIGDEKAFGKGATSGMTAAEATANRAKLIQAAQVLIAGREALGQPPLSMEQAFQKAYRLEFEDRVDARTNATIKAKVAARTSQFVGRAESIPDLAGRPVDETPEQRAIKKGRALLVERGHTTGPQANSMAGELQDGVW